MTDFFYTIKDFWPILLFIGGGGWVAYKRIKLQVPSNTKRIEVLENSNFMTEKRCDSCKAHICEQADEIKEMIEEQEKKREESSKKYAEKFEKIAHSIGVVEGYTLKNAE